MMYKLVACVLILFALMQKAVQDGNCPDCGVPTAAASITSTFSSSVDRTRQRRQAAINLEPGMLSLFHYMHACAYRIARN